MLSARKKSVVVNGGVLGRRGHGVDEWLLEVVDEARIYRISKFGELLGAFVSFVMRESYPQRHNNASI